MKRSLVLFVGLGACVSPPAPRPPAPPPARAVIRSAPLPPPPAIAWEDRARTPGDWRWQPGRAEFVAATGEVVSLTCSAGRAVMARSGGDGSLTVRTTTLARTLRPGETLPARDPLLDAIVFTRGKFMVAMPGLPDLILPPFAEVARVIEDCRD